MMKERMIMNSWLKARLSGLAKSTNANYTIWPKYWPKWVLIDCLA